jgi:hypothetical protein
VKNRKIHRSISKILNARRPTPDARLQPGHPMDHPLPDSRLPAPVFRARAGKAADARRPLAARAPDGPPNQNDARRPTPACCPGTRRTTQPERRPMPGRAEGARLTAVAEPDGGSPCTTPHAPASRAPPWCVHFAGLRRSNKCKEGSSFVRRSRGHLRAGKRDDGRPTFPNRLGTIEFQGSTTPILLKNRISGNSLLLNIIEPGDPIFFY